MRKYLLAMLALVAIFAVGCDTTAPTPVVRPVAGRTRTPTPVPATRDEAIRQLINAECESVVQQDIDRLQGMWLSDGTVTDANYTPDNPGDDVKWNGWSAIRDRYVSLVFPSNPTFCEHPNILVEFPDDNTAKATSDVKIGITNCAGCNQWVFKKQGNDWKIASLTYNTKK
jgi:hypothetical protein